MVYDIAAVFKSLGDKIQNCFQIIEATFKSLGIKIQYVDNLMTAVFMSPLRPGNYCTPGVWYNQKLFVEGSRAIVKDTLLGDSYDTKIEIGNFGKADPEIVEATGQEFYNMKLTIASNDMDTEYGVVRKDGAKITMKGKTGMFVLDWITQEEADALDADGDPVEAPPCPYKIQPDNQGKFLWITGPSGTGKSTSAHLLSKTVGYVYYEGDCFFTCKNPYMPVDAPETGMIQYQRNLIGEGLDARKKAHQIAQTSFIKHMLGEDFVMEDFKEFYGMMCQDIEKERKRIGGDWVVATFTMKREIRDFVKSCLGPELVFVVLTMEEEELKKRILRRHRGDAYLNEDLFMRMMALHRLLEPVGDDEENALEVIVTDDMTKDDVANKILQTVEQFEKMD